MDPVATDQAQPDSTTSATAVVEQEAPADAISDADFDAGFDAVADDDSTPTEETSPAASQTDETQAETVSVEETVPELAQMTKAQLEQLLKLDATVPGLKEDVDRKLSTAFGKLGRVEQILKTLQEETPAGQAMQVTDEDMTELAKEWPELSVTLLPGLNRIINKLKVRGTGLSKEAVDQLVSERVAHVTYEANHAIITALEPDWETTVRSAEFAAWMNQRPEDERTRLMSSQNPAVVRKTLQEFSSHQAKLKPAVPPKSPAPPAGTQRRAILEANVAPRSRGAAPAPSSRQVDPFDEGWNSV